MENNVIEFRNEGSNAIKQDRRIKDKLGFRDIWDINKKKRITSKLRNTYKADMEYRQLKSEIRLNELEAQQAELKQECKETSFKIKNMMLNNTLAQEERKNDYFKITNQNKRSSIINDKKRGDNLQKISLGLSYGSCATSIFGITIGFLATIFEIVATRKVSVNGFISLFIVFCSLYCFLKLAKNNNKVLETIPHQIHKFFDIKNKESVFTLAVDIVFVFANVILSIFTNYLFWKTTGLIFIGQIIFSFALDFGAIACTFTSYQFKELSYSEKYKNEILGQKKDKDGQKYTQEDDQKNEEQKMVDTLENRAIEPSENEKKKNKLTRKSNSKMTKVKMQKNINKLKTGTIITPNKVGMSSDRSNYKSWISQMKNIESFINENGHTKYKKVKADDYNE